MKKDTKKTSPILVKKSALKNMSHNDFGGILEHIDRIDTELQEIKAELSQKAQIKDVRELQNRVLKLEMELDSIRNSLHLQKS
jgi:hypothetical protein